MNEIAIQVCTRSHSELWVLKAVSARTNLATRSGREASNCCATIQGNARIHGPNSGEKSRRKHDVQPSKGMPAYMGLFDLQEIDQVHDRVGKSRYGVRADAFGRVAMRWEVGGNYLIGLAEFGDLITPHSPADKGAVY